MRADNFSDAFRPPTCFKAITVPSVQRWTRLARTGSWLIHWLTDPLLLTSGGLIVLAHWLPHSEVLFTALFPTQERVVYLLEPFTDLLWQHLLLVAASSLIAALVGSLVGIAVTRGFGKVFRPLAQTLTTVGQTVPPIAVLALAVPTVGFGERPALIALALYGLLPILQGSLNGLANVPTSVRESAQAMGMHPRQILWRIEIPLALPLWVAGLRTSVIINIGTAAIASTVGAKTLGSPIIVGLSGFNTAYVLQGAILVGLLAISADIAFERLARRFAWHA
jgi:osmoprotectant transport system permease protein